MNHWGSGRGRWHAPSPGPIQKYTPRLLYPHLWLYYTYICTRAIFRAIFFCRATRASKTRKKWELCKIQASVIFIYERHWTEAENGRGGPRRRSKAPTESHRINRFPAINQNYGGGTRFLFALALQPCWLNWWQLQSQIEITAFFSVPRVFQKTLGVLLMILQSN